MVDTGQDKKDMPPYTLTVMPTVAVAVADSDQTWDPRRHRHFTTTPLRTNQGPQFGILGRKVTSAAPPYGPDLAPRDLFCEL